MTEQYVRLSSKESTYGTDPAAGEQSYRVLSCSHKVKSDNKVVHTVESGVQANRKERVGISAEGSTVMNLVLDKKFGRWFAMVMGKEVVSTVNVACGQHVFTFKDTIVGAPWPSYTLHKGQGVADRPYPGAFGTRMLITCDKDGLVEITVDTASKQPNSGGALGALVDFSTQKYVSNIHLVTQTVGGTPVKFENWSIEIRGPAYPEDACGSVDVDHADVQPASVIFKGTIRFLTETHLTDFLAGTSRALVLKFDHGVVIPTSSPSKNFSLQFDIANLVYEDADVEINKQQRVVQVIGGECVQDATNALLTITLIDETLTSYA